MLGVSACQLPRWSLGAEGAGQTRLSAPRSLGFRPVLCCPWWVARRLPLWVRCPTLVMTAPQTRSQARPAAARWTTGSGRRLWRRGSCCSPQPVAWRSPGRGPAGCRQAGPGRGYSVLVRAQTEALFDCPPAPGRLPSDPRWRARSRSCSCGGQGRGCGGAASRMKVTVL